MPDVTAVDHRRKAGAGPRVDGGDSRQRRSRQRRCVRRRQQSAHRRGARQAGCDRRVPVSGRRHVCAASPTLWPLGGALRCSHFAFRAQAAHRSAAARIRRRATRAGTRDAGSTSRRGRAGRGATTRIMRPRASNGTREMRGTIDTARWQWYRSWIVRLEHERAVCAADVAARERDVARAAAAALTSPPAGAKRSSASATRRQFAWERAVAAEEQKQIDGLATLRHVAALRESAQRSRT